MACWRREEIYNREDDRCKSLVGCQGVAFEMRATFGRLFLNWKVKGEKWNRKGEKRFTDSPCFTASPINFRLRQQKGLVSHEHSFCSYYWTINLLAYFWQTRGFVADNVQNDSQSPLYPLQRWMPLALFVRFWCPHRRWVGCADGLSLDGWFPY